MGAPSLGFTILSFLLVIGPLIFVHEMGHYWVGRWFGVGAETFSIGFGPELLHWMDRRGTRWRVGALPLGGYVKFLGDMGVASEPDPKWLELPAKERNRCFHFKPIWQRALIVLAGPVINLLFAAVILGGFAYVYGDNVTPPTVGSVVPKSAAEKAGLRAGDRVAAMNGARIENYDQLFLAVQTHIPGDHVELAIVRDGKDLVVPMTLGARVEKDRFGNEYRFPQIGVGPVAPVVRSVGLLEAPVIGFRRTGMLMEGSAKGLVDIVVGRPSP